MRRALPLLLLLSALLTCTRPPAQIVRWPARYFHTGNGLPQNTVRDIIQDDEGWLWISTNTGLCLFDGYSFQLLDQLKGGEKLERGPARFMKDGSTIWVFQKKIIARYDGRQKKIEVYTVPSNNLAGITPVHIDSTRIIYTSYYSSYSFDTKTHKVTPVRPDKLFRKIRTSDIDHSILRDNDQYLVYTDMSVKKSFLTLIDPVTLTLSQTRPLPVAVHSVCRLDSSFLYLGIDNKLYYSRRVNDKLTPVAEPSLIKNKYDQLIQLKLNEHEYLVGTDNDIYHVTLYPSFSIKPVTQTDGSPLIRKGKLLCFFKDRAGNIWMGTNAEGLIQVPLSGNTFTLYRSSTPEKNFIRSIHIDTFTNNIWAGLYFDNMVVFDKYGLEKKSLTTRIEKLLGKQSVINYIHWLNRNEILAFAAFQRAYHINLLTNTVTLCEVTARDPMQYKLSQLNIGSVAFVMPVGKGRYLQLSDKLLLCISYQNNHLYINRIVDVPDGCGSIYKISDNNMWIGTKEKILNIDSTGAILDSILLPPDKKANAVIQDINHEYWVATDNGLCLFRDKKLVRTLSRKDGLPDDYFYALAADTAGYIWGSTNKGLVQVDIRTFRFRSFTEKDGLQGNEFNTGAVYQGADGKIFFGGISGFNAIDPAAINTHSQQLLVRFTDMVANNNSILDPLNPLPPEVSLPASSGNLSVAFSAFNFMIPGGNEYEYRLNDNKDWVSTAGQNTLQFFLTPGKYALQVRLKDKPDSVAAIQLTIEPPFYGSLWFIALCAILVLLIAGSMIYLSTREKYQKQIAALALREKVQQEKERISRELHDDLGVKANLLSYNASLLIDESVTDDKAVIGSRIKDAADDMLLALRETMWTLKQEHIPVGEVWVRFKNFISKMQRTYHRISFVIEQDIFAEKTLPYNDALNLVRIMQEAVNNAIRHSESIVVYCSAEIKGSVTVFTIRDEGKSFDEPTIEPGDGLSNMRYRAKQSGFVLTIQSVPQQGTMITVCV